MYKRVKLAFLCGFAALLLFLFIVPRRYVNRTCGELTALSQQASAAVRAGGDHMEYVRRMELLYEKAAPRWKLFLHHGEVDAVGAAIGVLAPLTEGDALLSALNAVNLSVRRLQNIESLLPGNVL